MDDKTIEDKVFAILDENIEKIRKAAAKIKHAGENIIYHPLFASLSVNGFESLDTSFLNGAMYEKTLLEPATHNGRVEIRIGSYEHGNAVAHEPFSLPYGLDFERSNILLQRAINETFWDALENYHLLLTETFGHTNPDSFLKFSKEKPVIYIEHVEYATPSFGEMRELMERVTYDLRVPGILDVSGAFRWIKNKNYFLNTEGTRILKNYFNLELALAVSTLDKENRVVKTSKDLYGIDEKVPDYGTLMGFGRELIKEAFEIRQAPIQKSGAFPVILDHKNHGVIWHEVVGHALEGHRAQKDEDGDKVLLFEGKIGQRIAPEFLTVYDNPATEGIGYYLYDEEGVRGKKVTLVKNGVLKGFLHSRESAGYFGIKSNGHGRAHNFEAPVSRMSNLIVESSKAVSHEELLEAMKKECYDQHKPYGLYLQGTQGGIAIPKGSFFNVFPAHVHRIYTDGKKQRVREVYIVGTPNLTLQSIMMTGNEYGVFSGSCGAESGWIPSTVRAPHALLKSADINRFPASSYNYVRMPVFSMK